MKNLTRKAKRREAKRFQVGDIVTWGNKTGSNTVVEVTSDGVYVDVSGEEHADIWASRVVGQRIDLFVAFDGNNRSPSGRGPLTLVERPSKPTIPETGPSRRLRALETFAPFLRR